METTTQYCLLLLKSIGCVFDMGLFSSSLVRLRGNIHFIYINTPPPEQTTDIIYLRHCALFSRLLPFKTSSLFLD